MDEEKKVVALVSGGVDSLAMVYKLLQEGYVVYPLYVRFGFLWEKAEIHYLSKWKARIRNEKFQKPEIVSLNLGNFYRGHWGETGEEVPDASSPDSAVYIPARNVILLSTGALWAVKRRIDNLSLGVLKGNPFKDATPEFLKSFEKALSMALSRKIKILVPLSTMTKKEVLKANKDLPYEITFSCINPQGFKHCGYCNKCQERKEAFKAVGLSF